MNLDDTLQGVRAGELPLGALKHAAEEGLTLGTVDARLSIPEVAEAFGGRLSILVREGATPATSRWLRAELVLWTREQRPHGARPAEARWRRLLALEAALDGAPVDVDADLGDPDGAVRAWAVVVADRHGELAGLRRALGDVIPEVRLLAAGGLLAQGDDGADVRGTLIDLLAVPTCSRDAVELLAPLREPSALAGLVELLDAGRRDVLRALTFPTALPVLERQILERPTSGALDAVRTLGAQAAPLLEPVMARLAEVLDAPRESDSNFTENHTVRISRVSEVSSWFSVIAALGDAALPAQARLLAWAERSTDVLSFFEDNAAVVAGRLSDDARATLAGWLDRPDDSVRRRALEALAVAGRASRPWRDAIASLLQHPDDRTAFEAARALAELGDTRAARDAWLDFGAWPLKHHGTPPALHRLADLLIRDLPGAVDLGDSDDVARTVRALDTLGLRTRHAWSGVTLLLGDDDARTRAAAVEALEHLRARLAAGPPPSPC